MTRGEYPNDADQNYQIEFGIAQPLRRGDTTEIETATIEKGYSVLDEDDNEVGGTLDERCTAIISILKSQYDVDADYMIRGDTIQFRPKKPR